MKRWLVPSFLIHTCLWKSHSNGIIFCHISQHEELTLEDTIIAFSHTDQNKTRQDHLTDQCLLLCWYNGIQGSLQGIYCKRVFLSFCQHIFNDVTGHKQNSTIRALSVTVTVNIYSMTGKAPHGVVALLHLAGVFVAGNVKDPDHQCCLQLSPPHHWIVIFFSHLAYSWFVFESTRKSEALGTIIRTATKHNTQPKTCKNIH